MSNPLDVQVDGGHYKELKIQPVEYIHANGLGFAEGAVVKYVSRHKAKNGARDLRKAIHFLELLLHLEYGESREEGLPPAPAVESAEPEGVAEALDQSPRFKYLASDPKGYHFTCPTCSRSWLDIREYVDCAVCGEQRVRGEWKRG